MESYRRFSAYRPAPKEPPRPPERPKAQAAGSYDTGELLVLMILLALYRAGGDRELLILLAVLALKWL